MPRCRARMGSSSLCQRKRALWPLTVRQLMCSMFLQLSCPPAAMNALMYRGAVQGMTFGQQNLIASRLRADPQSLSWHSPL